MKLVTERIRAREVASQWAKAYPLDGPYGKCEKKQSIARQLNDLNGETATADEIASIIGNNSWCGPSKCDECGANVDAVVEIGEEPDYESHTATICLPCLQLAVAMIQDAK